MTNKVWRFRFQDSGEAVKLLHATRGAQKIYEQFGPFSSRDEAWVAYDQQFSPHITMHDMMLAHEPDDAPLRADLRQYSINESWNRQKRRIEAEAVWQQPKSRPTLVQKLAGWLGF